MSVHPTAIVDRHTELDSTAEVGAYAVIGPRVKIGPRTSVGPHAVIEGDTTIGADNRIFQFAAIGAVPQDLKFAGEQTRLVIGDRNQIREFVTLHVGTAGGGGVTRIGNQNLLMANSHVAHDCQLGDGVVVANSVALAGHVVIGDHAVLGGLAAVHQFTRIGRHAFLGGGAMVAMDVPPFCTAQGDRAQLVGVNTVGLTRHGFSAEAVSRIKTTYKIIFRSGLGLREALAKVKAELPGQPEVEELVDFIEGSARGVTR
ncbi:MAG: acyl-ACP--UDP-N-acetylglucosamine O-acyltransferase [Myxococcales bacterium]